MKQYIKEYIGSDSSSEIDFKLYNELYGKDWSENDNDYDYGDFQEEGSDKAPWSNDSYPTNIDDFIKSLQEWKQKGATHLEVMYHCDHIGYELSFLKFKEQQ